MKNYRKTSDGKKGGLFVGKSHEKGGIPAIVVDTGQPIEVEGGEAIINKEATKKYWKELSKINQSAGNGNPIPPPQGFSDEVSQYSNGGKISKLAITEGTKHELEHSDTIAKFKKQGVTDKEVARKIALDHLKENPNYYKVLKKLKLKKGGEIVCRSCGWSWLESENPKGENLYKCHKCNSDNKNFYKTGGAVENKKEVYDEWKTLVNMSASELKAFLKTEDGKKAGLTKEKADELGIGSGHESASWILKMKAVPYTEWSDTMWSWAKRQIGFIKRMSGNKGGLYEDNGNKTRKHTSLLIWGHNPEKFMSGGLIAPNGKPSNLNPEQYKLVRTKAFKNWFGDWENDPENASKVVDENGEPLVVYHSSKKNFNVFNKRRDIEHFGIYFSANKDSTKTYGDITNEFFLNVRNPEVPQIWIHSIIDSSFFNRMKKNGLDGAFWLRKKYNSNDFELYEIVVFEPTQIKLADGTNTTFDSSNPDIRFNGGGNIPKIKESYALVVKISNIDSPNEIKFKGTKNKYLGTYKKIFDILNEDSIFNEVYAVDDVLVDNDLYVFFESNFEADKYDKISKLKNVEIISVMSNGGRTIAQTPAPKKDRIVGSEKNAPKSSESSKSAEKIVLSEQVLESIENILREYNKDTSKKVDLNTAKAVVRRGMGAYSSSHRPTISGGKPNSRVAWGLARLKAFLYKIENGESKSGKYSQDNDLIDDLGYEHEKFAKGNKINVENKDEYFDEMQSQVASTDDMIKLVANEREKKIKEWRKFEKVVVGRNDGYSWEDNTTNDNRKIALKPSRAKTIEIIKNNPNVTKIYFYGTIKAGQRVGEELEIVDDFAVVLWSKMESLFEKGFQFKTENGKYVNTIIDKNETFDYKNKKDNGDFVYYESIDKYGNIGQGRINVNVLKEDLENGFAVAINKTEVRKFAKGNKIKAENKGGNCYEMAGKLAMGIMFADKDISYPDFKGTPYVVHAEVSGQGAISGLRYGHAWVEDDMFIYDFSNGRKIVFPKELYYAIGNVITKPPKYYKYTFDEARKKMSETGHYGSWELKTESGL